jgi:phosphoglycolate phosphatase-like HAD superfamily hydrolase
MHPRFLTPLLFALLLLAAGCATSDATSVLPSWNDSAARNAILDYVETTTDPDSTDFIPPAERIAVFDNDGCLWAEQPAYFQLFFAIDRVKAMAPDHPEWRTTQPFQAVLEDDMEALARSGEEGLLKIVTTSHGGMTTEEFASTVRAWLDTARHPKTNRPYTEMVYQPMLEVLEHLRANGFKTFIVSGGGIEFLRVFAEEVYGIPPEQVVGSSIKTAFEMTPDGPVIRRLPEIGFIDDKAGKPIGIQTHIGRRPVAAFGNSDGDLQMLQWTHAGPHHSLCVIIHHTDAEREWAYDRDSHIGRLDKALDEAGPSDWTVVDMKNDWRRIFPD